MNVRQTGSFATSKTISVTDLRRRAGRVMSRLAKSDETITITGRGGAVAVIMSPARYNQIEEALRRLDEIELREMVRSARRARETGDTISQAEVKKRLKAGQASG